MWILPFCYGFISVYAADDAFVREENPVLFVENAEFVESAHLLPTWNMI